jgi:hypothetical protein
VQLSTDRWTCVNGNNSKDVEGFPSNSLPAAKPFIIISARTNGWHRAPRVIYKDRGKMSTSTPFDGCLQQNHPPSSAACHPPSESSTSLVGNQRMMFDIIHTHTF